MKAVHTMLIRASVTAVCVAVGDPGGAVDLDRTAGLSVAAHLARYQDEFACGVGLTSAYFAGQSLAVRFSSSLCYLDAVLDERTDSESVWTRFWLFRAGLVSITGAAGRSCRLYGEGGVALAVPVRRLSDDNAFGGYGLFGFEFFPGDLNAAPVSYFIELGGASLGARAERVHPARGYANGFLISTGFRLYP